MLSNVSCGLSLALVFGLGHNGMAVYDAAHRPDYWKLQVTTTRNVTQDSLGFVHWFCGGLDYQVEHHLFPTMPRHHLAECNRRVRKFCKDYGVTYHGPCGRARSGVGAPPGHAEQGIEDPAM